MNKTELIKTMSANTGLTQAQTRHFVDELVFLARLRLQNGDKFAIADLVQIEAVDMAARSGTAMGHKWTKPAHKGLRAKVIGAAKRMFDVGA